MTTVSESEKVIRRLYEITHAYEKGFKAQISELLKMGLERFNLDIAILSRIENGVYTVEHCVVPEEVELASGVLFDFDNTYCSITCQANGPVAIENMGKDDKYASHPAYQAFGLESYIGIPIRIKGELYGTLNFSSANVYPRSFNQIDIDALKLMASWVEVEIDRRQKEKQLKEFNDLLSKMAFEDSLTSLPNRRALFEHLSNEVNRAYRTKGQATLVMADIDHFKAINDTYGHLAGDTALAAIGDILRQQKRNYDYVARFGGEEFLLWLPDTTAKAALPICERINKKVAALKLTEKPMTLSFGLTEYQYQEEGSFDITVAVRGLIEEADQALYQAKENGRNRAEFYERL